MCSLQWKKLLHCPEKKTESLIASSLPALHPSSAAPVVYEHANPNDADNVAAGDCYYKMFHFSFLGGITFPDIISLNFTLTVDKEEKRPPGSGLGE